MSKVRVLWGVVGVMVLSLAMAGVAVAQTTTVVDPTGGQFSAVTDSSEGFITGIVAPAMFGLVAVCVGIAVGLRISQKIRNHATPTS